MDTAMTVLRKHLFAALALAALSILASPASAQTDDEEMARQLFQAGRGYFERADYERASEAFAEAYRLSGRPLLLVNQARALEAMGRNEEAVEALDLALSVIPADSDTRAEVEHRRNRLAAQVARDREATEEEPAEQPVETAAPGAENLDQAPATSAADSGRGGLFWAGVASVGVGGAALVTSLATGLASNNIESDLEASCPGGVCDPSLRGDVSRGKSLAAASTAMLFVGIGASATGVVLMLLPGGDADEEPQAGDVDVVAGPGQVGAGMRLTF